jgi:hypothetical protein
MLKVGAQVGCDASAFQEFCRPEKGAPMPCRYCFEDLLALLYGFVPAKVDAVALHHRRVEHGCLSVGLKIHCLGDGSQFSTLVEGLGGAKKILDVNYYKHSRASLCLVLPPVGSARSAILLLECIEHFIRSPLFSNPEIQIQVCSPGRLDARRSALLAIGLLGVGYAAALHSGRSRDILFGRPTLSARETFGALRCRGGLRPKF